MKPANKEPDRRAGGTFIRDKDGNLVGHVPCTKPAPATPPAPAADSPATPEKAPAQPAPRR